MFKTINKDRKKINENYLDQKIKMKKAQKNIYSKIITYIFDIK